MITVLGSLAAGRGAWIQAARGSVDLNGVALDAGDGAAVEDEPLLMVAPRGAQAGNLSEVLLFDLGR